MKNIAWAAGLFEGEGCIDRKLLGVNKLPSPRLQLVATDEDVVRDFAEIVGGSVYGPYIRNNKISKKPQYLWVENKILEVQQILQSFWPFLGQRRKSKAAEVFADYYAARYKIS